jgi:hypothetical protein
MLTWLLFASILGDASNSLISNANLIGKLYFPRTIIPTSSSGGVGRLCDQPPKKPLRVVFLSPAAQWGGAETVLLDWIRSLHEGKPYCPITDI